MQVIALTRLRQLTLDNLRLESSDHAPLAALGSLRVLALNECLTVPSNLSQLTWLEAFSLFNAQHTLAESADQTLLPALPRLTGLRHLALDRLLELDSPPAALAGLSQLQTFIWLDVKTPDADAVLPAGLWLRSLRRLAAPAGLLANSLPLLTAAPCLEHLVVTGFAESAEAEAAAHRILRTALRWSSLRQLVLAYPPTLFVCGTARLSPALMVAALLAQREHPSLCIELSPMYLSDLWLDATSTPG